MDAWNVLALSTASIGLFLLLVALLFLRIISDFFRIVLCLASSFHFSLERMSATVSGPSLLLLFDKANNTKTQEGRCD